MNSMIIINAFGINSTSSGSNLPISATIIGRYLSSLPQK
jgi:hypothetical protein